MRIAFGIALMLMMIAGFARYATEIAVKDARGRLTALEIEADDARRIASILRAESAHLENPNRIAKAVQDDLNLQPLEPYQMVGIERAIAIMDGRALIDPPVVLAQQFDPFAEFANLDSTRPAQAATDADAPVLSVDWRHEDAI